MTEYSQRVVNSVWDAIHRAADTEEVQEATEGEIYAEQWDLWEEAWRATSAAVVAAIKAIGP